MHIFSSYAIILGETNFRTQEIPGSGSKAKDGEKERNRERKTEGMVITMAKLRMAHASTHGARKPPGPKKKRRERLSDGDNNGQGTHGARKHTWRTQAAWVKKEERKTEQW